MERGRDLPEVDDFVEKLVDEDEVVLNVLLGDLPEIVLHHLNKLNKQIDSGV